MTALQQRCLSVSLFLCLCLWHFHRLYQWRCLCHGCWRHWQRWVSAVRSIRCKDIWSRHRVVMRRFAADLLAMRFDQCAYTGLIGEYWYGAQPMTSYLIKTRRQDQKKQCSTARYQVTYNTLHLQNKFRFILHNYITCINDDLL